MQLTFNGEVERKLEEGKLIPLAMVYYNPENDSVEYYFPVAGTKQEKIAMLKKFECWPNERD